MIFANSVTDDMDDLVRRWSELDRDGSSLPLILREPQRDALFWLERGKNVLLCIGTGKKYTVHLLCKVQTTLLIPNAISNKPSVI